MRVNRSFRRISVLLLCSCLTPVISFCGTKAVPGLNIQKVATPLTHQGKADTPPSSRYLDELLTPCVFHGTHIGYDVETSFAEGDHNDSEDDSEMTNTDLESIEREESKEEKKPSEKPMLFALNAKPGENDSKKKYLFRESEVDTPRDFTKNLCTKLAQDACHIANADKSSFTRNSTTCLCVAIRDEKGNAKKLVFHNGKDKMGPNMEKRAQELRYGIRTGYQAHAEAEFIQFLLQREQQNKERYTHILGMGCSRTHCRECDALLQLFLGKGYHQFTAAAKIEESTPPVITNTESGCVIRSEVKASWVYEKEAVSQFSNRSQRYYLPRSLREHINQKTGFNIDFSTEDRFIIKTEKAVEERRQKSDRKRRVSALSSGLN